MPRRAVIGAVVLALAVFAAVLLTRPRPVAETARSTSIDQIRLIWVNGGDQLHVEAYGYRPKAIADIRLGGNPVQQARADETGKVLVNIPRRLVTAGQPGMSIIVVGRSKYGMSRVLVSAVQPPAAGPGPIDALPWAVPAVMLAGIGLRMLRQRARRRPLGQ